MKAVEFMSKIHDNRIPMPETMQQLTTIIYALAINCANIKQISKYSNEQSKLYFSVFENK
jgi:hypothetical protein